MKNPCKGCPDQGCGKRHDTCEQYIAWKNEHHDTKEWLKQHNPNYSPARRKRMDKEIVKNARGWRGISQKFYKTED